MLETDQMDVDEEPPVSSRPKTSKTAPAKKAPVKMKPTGVLQVLVSFPF
jgi:hypothetical protein